MDYYLKTIIRPATDSDIDYIASMIARLKTLNEEFDESFKVVDNLISVAKTYIEESLRSDNVIVLVADVGGQVVGFIRVELRSRIFYKPTLKAVITEIYVKPSYRRRGVGRLLVEAAAEEARKRGASLIAAEFPLANVMAKTFYEKLGFKELQVEYFREI